MQRTKALKQNLIKSEKRGYWLSLGPVAAVLAAYILITPSDPLSAASNWLRLAVYAGMLVFSVAAIRVLKRRDRLGVMPSDFLGTFSFGKGGEFYSGILPSALSLFILTYFIFSIVIGQNLYPAMSLWLIPVVFIMMLAIYSIEEIFWRGLVQHELYDSVGWGRPAALAFSAASFGAYFALSRPFPSSFILKFLLGTVVGAVSAYIYNRTGKVSHSILMRVVYETLVRLVLV